MFYRRWDTGEILDRAETDEEIEKLKAEAVIRVSAEAARYYTAPAVAKTEEKPAS